MQRAPIVDCHMHTFYSDGEPSVEENVQAALAAGCRIMAATDHLALAEWMDCSIKRERIEAYWQDIAEARGRHPEIEIVCGFEADWYPGVENDISFIRPAATYVLGSVHYLDEYAIDWDGDLRIWELMSADDVWKRYVDDWCQACFCPFGFDSMAHPDLIKLFGRDEHAPSRPLVQMWGQMAEAAREADVHVEINTAALRKHLGEFYPSPGLLRAFFDAEVPITVGSDAHKAQDVCAGIQDAYRFAFETGYRTLDVPRALGGWTTFEL